VRFLVTAGPTREPLDDVRFLANASSGRMGFAIAEAAMALGHQVRLVHGPVAIHPPFGAEVVRIGTAEEMREACLAAFPSCDAVFMTAAVADYRPAHRVPGKMKKSATVLDLPLAPNPDILAELGRSKAGQTLVGFALEAEGGEENARRKLVLKRLDLIVLDSPAALGADVSDFRVLFADGRSEHHMSVSKDFLALWLVSAVVDARLSLDR